MASFLDSLSGIPEALLGAGRNFLGYVTGVDALNELARQRQDRRNLSKALRTGDVENIAQYSPVVAGQLQDVQGEEEAAFRAAGLRATRAMQQLVAGGASSEDAFDAVVNRAPGLFADPEEMAQVRDFVVQGGPEALSAMEAGLSETNTSDLPAAIQQAQYYKALSPEDRQLYSEALRRPIVRESGGRTFLVGPGGLQQTLQTPETTAAGEQAVATGREGGGAAAKALNEAYTEAQQAQGTLDLADRAKELLGEGVITGSAATQRLAISKVLSYITGQPVSDDAAATAEYRAIVGGFTAQAIQAFGAGTGLSDADREFAAAMAGGDLTAGARALKKIIDIVERESNRRIDNYEQRRSGAVAVTPSIAEQFPSFRQQAQEISLEEFLKGGE